MWECRLCRFHVELDDTVLVIVERAACICLRCWLRTLDDTHAMSADLRREVVSRLAGIA
jgi:hypothetical protein